MATIRAAAQTGSKLRIGVIGAGGNTKLHHIPKLQAIPGVEVVAIANRTAESAAKAGEPFGITKATGNWREIIEDATIDAVVIGTWPYLHRTLVLEALRAGKHVLTEARLAMNAAEARELYQESLRHPHLVTQVVPSPITFKYDATIQDIIQKKLLGELVYVEVKGLSGTFAEAEGSPLTWRTDSRYSGLNIGVMGIFYEPLQRWLGDAASVSAKAKTVVKVRTDGDTGEPTAVRIPDHLDILAELAIGAQAHLVFSSVIGAVPGQLKGYTLYGKEGTLHLDLDAGKLLLGLKSEGGQLKEVSIDADKAASWRVEEEFVGAIRGTEKVRRTTFEQGVRYMEFTEAVTQSRLSNAPQLHKVTDTLSLLVDSNGEKIFVGGFPLFLIDENGTLVQSLEKWLEIFVKCLGNTGNSLLPGLFINGLIKTGKSNMLNMVLPAVLRRHQNFGVGGDNELLICRLDFDDIATGQTYSHALRRFATALLNWAAGGELQAWFLREKEDADRARNLWRILVNKSPDTVVFAFSGGSMCSVGANVSEGGAAMSEATVPFDIGKLLRISRGSMPASISDAAAAETWAHMQVACAGMPAEFGMFMYGRLPAMQVSCCQDYIRRIRSPNAPAELLAFVQEFEINSLLVEVAKDLLPVLRMLPTSAHDHLLRLAKGEGVPLGVLNYTILQLLRPCLSALFTEDGVLRSNVVTALPGWLQRNQHAAQKEQKIVLQAGNSLEWRALWCVPLEASSPEGSSYLTHPSMQVASTT
ncbi:hypothetical protein COCSUDRAFT_64103 [Coccomyxa subellipsoidea C-169]|uniref:Uncharacterized protein n=1 Tax=Coccomyxa subellipsoidea (strain C-169) TaxID=574566 RepID=I0Z951_COCSC|nr:hypothetical protein COCSUDRAFT_64103 [Coccomyxa subellipsoidea C-169]EIE27170.1 hypothetical protein COCSUDRAFT_64103 [Coccomyxa subellipsoidea C-169]|eukprot:XP_005651714.1 hypothetical protein COCSUDRAFT_64103 [Coccomyxa subellipsoidea C-169]